MGFIALCMLKGECIFVKVYMLMSQQSQAKIIPISSKAGLSGAVESFLKDYFAAHNGELPTTGLYDRILQEVERPLLKTTLRAVMGNQKKAAEILGINRNTLRKKLTTLGIDVRNF
jgi:two-component system nitrogen regulation response regulator GlnG